MRCKGQVSSSSQTDALASTELAASFDDDDNVYRNGNR